MAMSAASGERQYPSDDDIYVCGGDSGMMRDSHGHLQRGVLAMMRRRVAIGCALLIVVAAAGFLVVRSHTSPGPLQALSAGGQAIVDGASVEVTPGESADFTAFVWNRLTSPVTLVSATIVPVTGYAPTGKLAHVAISTTNGLVGASVGWPIIHPVFPARPLGPIGHGQHNIVFGITGDAVGYYYAAGLKIGYRYQGRMYYVTAWAAVIACVARRETKRSCSGASAAVERIQDKVQQMAAG
jgi:hypothetical protein